MRSADLPSPAIVVGIDGSQAAISAALWAVDEAVRRDIPLRLVYAIEPDDRSGHERDIQEAAREFAGAEIAVRAAVMAVESTDEPVKIEVEIAQDRPARVLREQSRSAPMLCVAALGIRQATGRRVGSTAAALAEAAHCPVAVIRGHNHNPGTPRWVVAVVDESPESHDVLDLAVTEALLRRRAAEGADDLAPTIHRHVRRGCRRGQQPAHQGPPGADVVPVSQIPPRVGRATGGCARQHRELSGAQRRLDRTRRHRASTQRGRGRVARAGPLHAARCGLLGADLSSPQRAVRNSGPP